MTSLVEVNQAIISLVVLGYSIYVVYVAVHHIADLAEASFRLALRTFFVSDIRGLKIKKNLIILKVGK